VSRYRLKKDARKVDLDELPHEPKVFPQPAGGPPPLNDVRILECRPRSDDKADWTPGNPDLQEMSVRVGDHLVGHFVLHSEVSALLGTVTKTIRTPCVGAKIVNSKTSLHVHAMGTLNLSMGSKEWWLWHPDEKDVSPATCIHLKQGQGEIMWVPPRWQHCVHTTAGNINYGEGDECNVWCTHWIWQCIPPQMQLSTLFFWNKGNMREEQTMTHGGLAKKELEVIVPALEAWTTKYRSSRPSGK